MVNPVEIQGSLMYLREDDSGISEELLLKGIHEPLSTVKVLETIKDGMNVLEIGANIGYFALLEAKQGAVVHAIEPVPENMEVLLKSIEANGYDDMFVYMCAIGDKNETMKMRVTKYSNSGTLIDMDTPKTASDWYHGWLSEIHTTDLYVECYTLDTFVEKYDIGPIDYIRMDVEGFETNVIKGATKTLESMVSGSILFIEIHPVIYRRPKVAIKNMIKTILKHGFTPTFIDPPQEEYEGEFIDQEFLYGAAHCPRIFFVKE